MPWFRRTASAAAAFVVAAWCLHVGAQTATPASRQIKQRRSADDKRPLQLFPVATMWTLALNNELAAAPAFDGKRGFFPLEGDQLAAYDLVEGRQLWIAPVQTTVEPVAGNGLVLVFEPESLVALRVE